MKRVLVFEKNIDPFLVLDLSEAQLFVTIQDPLDDMSKYSLAVHGAVINLNDVDEYEGDRLEGDMFINAKAILSFCDVKHLDIKVRLYDDSGSFLRLESGKPCEVAHQISTTNNDVANIYKHEIESVINWPYGYCSLALWTNESVSFEFDDEDLVPFSKYVQDPSSFRV